MPQWRNLWGSGAVPWGTTGEEGYKTAASAAVKNFILFKEITASLGLVQSYAGIFLTKDRTVGWSDPRDQFRGRGSTSLFTPLRYQDV